MSYSNPHLCSDDLSWIQEFTKTLKLSLPLIATFLGYQFISLCDTFVSARMSTELLAAVSLGSALYWVCTIFPLGILLSLDPLVAQALGAQNPKLARLYCRQGLSIALLLSIIFIPIILLSTHSYWPWTPENPQMILDVNLYIQGRIYSVPFLLMHTCIRCFLQSHQKIRPILQATLWANLLNFPLSIYLAGGDQLLASFHGPRLGLLEEGYGVWGIGIASSIVSALEVIFLLYCASIQEKIKMIPSITFTHFKKITLLGIPIGGALVSEGGVFSASTLIVSAWTAVEIGGHQVTLQLSSFAFTTYLGIANATAVRVGHAVGAKRWPKARQIASTGVVLGFIITLCVAALFIVGRYWLPQLITTDKAVIQQVGLLLVISAAFQVFDGAQVILAGALRGAGFTKIPLWSALVSHWGIGLPCALIFAFTYQYKTQGLWWGLCCGLASASIILSYSFWHLSHRAEQELLTKSD
jgi:multidrug resistance protein, MATE family